LNSLLSILNERLFFNDGQPIEVPLQFCVGTSNELPEDQEELGALWDRFLSLNNPPCLRVVSFKMVQSRLQMALFFQL